MTTVAPDFASTDTNMFYRRVQVLKTEVLGDRHDTAQSVIDTIKRGQEQEDNRMILQGLRELMSAIYRQQRDFAANTHLLAQLNESYNANRYIANTLTAEKQRVSKLDKASRTDVHRMRMSHLDTAYLDGYYQFMTRAAIFSTFMVVLTLLPVSLWASGSLSTMLMAPIVTLLLVVYATALALIYRNKIHRRNNDWNHRYWKISDEVRRSLESSACPGDD
jgi:hypothetical protein